MKRIISIFCLILSTIIWAQLAISVTGTAEDCPGQGALSWEVTGKDPNGSIIYTIVNTSDQTQNPYTTSSLELLGLVAGDYTVTATETISNGSNTITHTASESYTIQNNVIPFAYDVTYVSKVKCANDAFANITVTSGKKPYIYSLTKEGTVIEAPRTINQNVFSLFNLGVGIYSIDISDACGTNIRKDITVIQEPSYLNELQDLQAYPYPTNDSSCGTSVYTLQFQTAAGTNVLSEFNFPIQATLQYTNPETGAVVNLQHTITSISSINYRDKTMNYFSPKLDFPTFDVPVNATITLTDPCNTVYQQNIDLAVNDFFIDPQIKVVDCGAKYVQLVGNNTHGSMTITQVLKDGVSFDLSTSDFLINSQITSSTASLGSAQSPLAEGTYSIIARDACGTIFTKDVVISNDNSNYVPRYTSGTSCQNGFSDMQWYYTSVNGIYVAKFEKIELLEAPATYTGTLPQTFLPDVNNRSTITIRHLPDGAYKFRITNSCGQVINLSPITLTQNSKVENFTSNIVERCGTFDIIINDQISTNFPSRYILMKYDETTGNWINPEIPSVIYQNGLPTYYQYMNQSVQLKRGTNYNLQYKGKMRVVRAFKQNFLPNDEFCTTLINEFDIEGDITITSVYAFQCMNDLYDVLVDAQTPNVPLNYRIINKDGSPFVLDNGDNPIFEGLEAGVYDFEVTDACNDVLIRRLDVTNLNPPTIKPVEICEGQPGSLAINGISYLNFEWYKEGAPDVILSTSNQLEFASFERVRDQGTYYLNITTPASSSSSCINTTLSFTIQSNNASAYAGVDTTQTICYPDAPIDLTDYIDQNADTYGTFTSTNVSADLLAGNTFFANRAEAGTYTFTYTIDGGCDTGKDTSTIIIETSETEPPVISNCPTDIYVENSSIEGIAVNFPTPDATDNCKLQSIVASQASGTQFEPGTTTVVFTALDASGNSATCSFDIIVQTPLMASNDIYSIKYADELQGVGNILTNDVYNTNAPSLSDVNVSTVIPATPIAVGASIPKLNSNGLISIPAGTPIGNYEIEYQICDSNDSRNCKTATIFIEVISPICNKAPNLTGTPNESPSTGITSLNKFRTANWLTTLTNGYVAIDGLDKGMVVTRNADPATNIANPVDGMIVWDTTNQCLSLYTTVEGWHCTKQGCNE